MKQISEGVFQRNRLLYTKNLVIGTTHFQETILTDEGTEYRQWDARSSKLASAMLKGMKCPIKADSRVLYLGASHGYTPSYISDIARNGFIFAVEFAPRVMRDLIFVSEKRENIAPILADANKPETYYHYISPADIVYQDIAQKNQLEIFLKNTSLFLKDSGHGFLALKARSIDTTREPRKIYQEAKAELSKHMRIIEYRTLEPFQKDHCIFLCTKK
ncbi:fibrillarin-like rRNA/tRNA 2'-O-methyltransferase [Candidatus Woesearchaeota archaeon]|nr:fibrillarin-like rRNA/tRNA 2'-O-methyltransferase [Candidatus Woesearchaeota archaeon]